MTDPLLRVDGLTTHFHTDEGVRRAVDGVSFDVGRGETVALVGESGSGKTVLAESITRLIDAPPGEIVEGRVVFDGIDLTTLGARELRRLRGARIAHVFQHPQDALNPVQRVGAQVAEVLRIHGSVGRREARRRAIDALERVGLPDPAARADDYPHELSGGMRQRAVLAMALVAEPDLLIADEPTTALDVTVQAQLLDLLADLQGDLGMAVLFISHDLGVVAQVADRVVVLYAGEVMERGRVEDVFAAPGHPYTRGLLACLPGRGAGMGSIGGELPSPTDPPDGCRFAPRCPYAIDDCATGGQPPLAAVDGDPDHLASCLFHGPDHDRARLDAAVDWGRREGDARGR